jgi:thymidylate synthase (FAD)
MITKPSVTLLFAWGSEEFITAMSDVLYRGYSIEEALKRVRSEPSLIERRLTQLLRDGHHNVFEFIGASWLIEGSRALTHELVRHRLASYWQESQRYVDYAKNPPRFIIPPGIANSLTPLLDRFRDEYNAIRSIAPPECPVPRIPVTLITLHLLSGLCPHSWGIMVQFATGLASREATTPRELWV